MKDNSQNSTFPNPSLFKWNRRMLPMMKWMVIGLTLFFFLSSVIQLFFLQKNIYDAPHLDIERHFADLTVKDSEINSLEDAIRTSRFKTLIALETNVLQRRHHQANVLLMSRVWVRYLGFVTGMILALVGAVFILGKLQEPTTQLEAKLETMQFNLKSSSPGIIMSLLGVALMLTTIVTHHTIEVKDAPVYVKRGFLSPSIIEKNEFQLDTPEEVSKKTKQIENETEN